MALPGTQIANKVLDQTRLRSKFSRLYTQARSNDRTHKIWGSFSDKDGKRLLAALVSAGVSNPRLTYVVYGYRRGQAQRAVSGVRFEVPKA
jgi:hypothetical protein